MPRRGDPGPVNMSSRGRKNPRPKSKVEIEIIKLQATQQNLIPKAPFARVIREVMQDRSRFVNRMTKDAFHALQEAAETYLVCLFEDAYKITRSRKQVTLKPADMVLVRDIRREI